MCRRRRNGDEKLGGLTFGRQREIEGYLVGQEAGSGGCEGTRPNCREKQLRHHDNDDEDVGAIWVNVV